MKKIIILILVVFLIPLTGITGRMEIVFDSPSGAKIQAVSETAVLTWQNPSDPAFSETIVFRSSIPIENYFSFEAVQNLCEKIYQGTEENYVDTGLAVNLPYYYVWFSRDKSGDYSKALVLKKGPGSVEVKKPADINTLADAASDTVNSVSLSEAGMIYNFNGQLESDDNSRRLALFIIVKSPHDLTEKDKNAISYFIHNGTPTTILLGSGERAGVLNSYLSVFNKLPRNELEWQDIIKIGNGRWPDERNIESEEKAANDFFSAIYIRKPDMNNPNDNAAVTVIAYGLRPGKRNLESEKNAVIIFRAIFGHNPVEASDWDMVRAIAYSGATR